MIVCVDIGMSIIKIKEALGFPSYTGKTASLHWNTILSPQWDVLFAQSFVFTHVVRESCRLDLQTPSVQYILHFTERNKNGVESWDAAALITQETADVILAHLLP